MSFRTSGAGGVGDPLRRDPDAVRRDVVEGFVSREAAEVVYGVRFTDERMEHWAPTTERLQVAHAEVGFRVAGDGTTAVGGAG